jgi:hypothetical protein
MLQADIPRPAIRTRTRSRVESALYCNFCGRPQHEVRYLISGPTVSICDECIAGCQVILDRDLGAPPEFAEAEYLSWGIG